MSPTFLQVLQAVEIKTETCYYGAKLHIKNACLSVHSHMYLRAGRWMDFHGVFDPKAMPGCKFMFATTPPDDGRCQMGEYEIIL